MTLSVEQIAQMLDAIETEMRPCAVVEVNFQNEIVEVPGDGPWMEHAQTGRRWITLDRPGKISKPRGKK